MRNNNDKLNNILTEHIRNVAIIAHVDHGKTTLVDSILRQSAFIENNEISERVMDSNVQEVERGITITGKSASFFGKKMDNYTK